MSYQIDIRDTIYNIDAKEWNKIAKGPFFSHEWFQFAEAMSGDTLRPHYFMARQEGAMVVGLPAFIPQGAQNPYEASLLGRHRESLIRVRLFQRQPMICYSPFSGGAYFISDNPFREDVLNGLLATMEKSALQGGQSEVVFWAIKETEPEWRSLFERRGYRRVYINSVGIIRNKFESFEDYLQSLAPKQRKMVKGDIRAFRKSGFKIDTWEGSPYDVDSMTSLAECVDRRYPSARWKYSKRFLWACFDRMAAYREHCGISDGEDPIGCLTYFVKDGVMNTYAMGLNFAKVRTSRTYFNLLYYHTIRKMIAQRVPYVNFNQAAYKVKESRGCALVPQYMYVKILRNRLWMALWLSILDRRYRHKFALEYHRNLTLHHGVNPRQSTIPEES